MSFKRTSWIVAPIIAALVIGWRARSAPAVAPAAAFASATAEVAPSPAVVPGVESTRVAPAPAAIAPQSPSAEERAASRIDELVGAGSIGPARDAAEEFLQRYPDSKYAVHVQTLTGVHSRPVGPGFR